MLSRQEQQIWDDVLRSWDEEVEEPPGAGRPVPARDPDHLPAPVVGGAWVTIMLILFGAAAVGLVVAGVTAVGWALWRSRQEPTARTGQAVP